MSKPAKGITLLDVLTQHAENGWVCPSIPQLANLCGIEKSSVSTYLLRLRKDGKITSRLVSVRPWGQARVVTILATGKSTATPQPSTRLIAKSKDPPFTPIAGLTTAGRQLEGEERAYWKSFYEAREAEERRRRQA